MLVTLDRLKVLLRRLLHSLKQELSVRARGSLGAADFGAPKAVCGTPSAAALEPLGAAASTTIRPLPRATTVLVVVALCMSLLALSACGGGDETSGDAWSAPATITDVSYDMSGAYSNNGASIDASHTAEGYVSACATNSSRLKLQVTMGQMSYNYDLAGDGTVTIFPLQMGDGYYVIRVMQNTSDNNYVEICRVETTVQLNNEYEPFIRPSAYCSFSEDSECVALAREITQDCTNEGDVVKTVYTYLTDNITYDSLKATSLADATGYLPDPDTTLREKTGICFDYASLAAAMLRSLGIPCKIVTGYVSNDIYHAWNMVYIDGSWKSTSIEIDPNTWSLIDTTFGASGAGAQYVGDGSTYIERYTY